MVPFRPIRYIVFAWDVRRFGGCTEQTCKKE